MSRGLAGTLLLSSGLTVGFAALATAGRLRCGDNGVAGDAWIVATVATGLLLAAGIAALTRLRLLPTAAVALAVGAIASGGIYAWGFVMWVYSCTS